ncbi:hypothetical protein B188_28830 [Candidatus Brocadiaceae bacterium B188]|nr:hypothetical protein B188_28830 [Candidatus Brocadiaceae bacterium B188]
MLGELVKKNREIVPVPLDSVIEKIWVFLLKKKDAYQKEKNQLLTRWKY